MNPSSNVRLLLINEVSLEGLDGITLQALWLRISEETKTKLPFPEALQVDYWNIIRRIIDFKFYELEKPRPDLVLYDRFMFIDSETECSYYEPEEIPIDIYLHKAVNDPEKRVRGSCATYFTRKDISDEARKMEYKVAKEKWGNKLVIVASQECRDHALIGSQTSSNVELTSVRYCILERIGRSRYHGEITQGKRSLQILGEDPKSLFYHRKVLLKHKLITKQVYHQKCGAQNFSGTLLHLSRYYSEKKSKPLILTEQIVEILRNKPNYRALYSDITAQLNITSTTKKLFKSPEFQRFVKTDIKLPYREFYPDATIAQWKHKNSDKERLIRVMQLIDPDIDVAEHWCKLDENEEEEEENGYQNYENLRYGVSLLSQAAGIVRSHGGNGCCQAELGEIMGQGKLNARSFCRNLLRRNVVTCVMNDVGRQRVTRFVSRKFEHKGQMTLQFKQERDKMMTLLSSINTNAVQNTTEVESLLAETDTEDTITKAETTNMSDTSSVSILPESKEQNTLPGQKNEAISSEIVESVKISEESMSVNSETKSDDENSINIDAEIPVKKMKLEENKRKADSQLDEPEAKKIKTIDIDNIEVKMVVAKTIPGLKGYSQGFSEQLKNEMLNASCVDGSKVTYRLLRRANFIIECVRQEKVIADLTKLIKMIQDDEKDEGYNVKIDKKSLMRLLLKLAKDGYVKYMKATLSSGKKVKSICFVCDPSITENHSVIQSALEQAKMKFYIEVKPPTKLLPKQKDEESIDDTFNTELVNQGRKEIQMVSSIGKIEYKYDRTAARKYGFSPKFVRMRLIHELLYHLIYVPVEDPVTEQEEMQQLLKELGQSVDEKLLEELSPVYYKKGICWKTFIPPIPTHAGWPKGWTLICDVLLRLPLSIFVQCFNVPYKINDIDYYLNHPVRKHVLVRNLPPKMRNGLMHKRKYIFAMHEIVSRLCYIGLVQFGPQRLKEKDQVFIYLNKKASLWNTVPSQPGYHETTRMDYERHMYYFKSIQDIEQYWYELWTICMNTTLGGRLCVTGKYIVLEQLHTKHAMLDAVLPRLPNETAAKDNGDVPGDKRGAAGFDSALFAHLKRNWNWLNTSEMVEYESKQLQRKKTDVMIKPRKPDDIFGGMTIKKHVVTGPARPLNKIRKTITVKSPERAKKYKIKQKQIVRKVLPVRSKRKPFYDEVDKLALKKMDKLRTDWSPLEDHVLLLCTVGSKYLCPNRRRQIVSFTVIRDVLHKLVHTSACKTSRACQRRILYIMKNANTRRSVNMCLEEIRQNASVSKKYSDIVKRTQNQHIPDTELNIAFVELVAYMSRMFSNLIKPEKKKICNIPSTMKEFKENCIICGTLKKSASHFKEPQTIHDINFSVVKTIIHSSMCCIKDKTSWAYQLFKVYQQYPETLLRSVITKSRHEQMVSLKKAFVKSHKSGACMPLSSSPYQLSISYKYQLHSKYPYMIYQEAFGMLKAIAEWENETRIGEHQSAAAEGIEVQCPRSGTAIALMEMAQKVDVEFKFDIPEDVIILDHKVQDDSAYDRIIERYYNILRDPQNFSGWEKKQGGIQNGSDDDEDEQFPNFNLDESTKKNMDSYPRPNSRIAFYMMRAEMCEGVDDKSTQHLHDFFVVNASKVFLKLPESLKQQTLKPEDFSEDLSLIKTKISNEIISSIKSNAIIPIECANESELLDNLATVSANETDISLAKNIINYVLNSGIIGSTLQELKELIPEQYEGNMKLLDLLNILSDSRILIQTGISKIRYVHFEHKKPWIIHSYKILRLDREKMPTVTTSAKEQLSEKLFRHKKNFSYIELQKSKQRLDLTTQQEVRVLISPWIRIDGSLNRRVLDRWLGSVLIATIDQPGITLEALSHKFHYMKPVDIMTLVKYLTKLKCVQQSVTRKAKTTLFSGIPNISQVPATGLEDPREILIEPYCDAVSKLAIFIGEKSYSTDFLL